MHITVVTVSAPEAGVEPMIEDVVLRDGSTLRLRAPTAADEEVLIDFFGALSSDSRYLRFHGTTTVGSKTVAGALETDWQTRGSLLGELADPDGRVRPGRARARTFACTTHIGQRSHSRSQTNCTAAESALDCSSVSQRMLPQPASTSWLRRFCHRTARCSACSTTPDSRALARCKAA